MIKSFAYIYLLVFLFQNTGDKIYWDSQVKLKFEDFQAAPDSINFDGMSGVDVEYSYHLDSNIIHYNITCYFYKLFSWLKVNDGYLLNHEQGHFDIGEIRARRIRKHLHFLKSTIFEDINREVFEIRNGDILDSVYDKETDYGTDLEAQQIWNNRIAYMLDTLKDYSAPEDSCVIR